jgi:glutamate-1-semialdehyde 2,1-aminomutase
VSDPQSTRQERRERFFTGLVEEYRQRFPSSQAFQARAATRLVDGGSHTLRLPSPFPLWTHQASGAYFSDRDGHHILDYWQGHFANILGHNPPVVTQALATALQQGHGLQSGLQDEWEWDLADLICQHTGAERVRFTTSGTLATMYAILLARSHTGRDLVLKAGGGWHGAHPWGLKGVNFGAQGYADVESAGLPASVADEVIVTRYNDVAALDEVFRRDGDRIACFIVEPWIGSGGGVPALPEYLSLARELTARHGALLICDEVIAAFRFGPSTCASLYHVTPDLTTLGKIIGGGMPVAAVAGRADILRSSGRAASRRVRFDGGTYSAHPLSLLAGATMIRHLVANQEEIYPRLGAMGVALREAIEGAFAEEEIRVRCTGASPAFPSSSMAYIQYPCGADLPLDSPDAINDPQQNDVDLRERVSKLAFLIEGVHTVHGLGALSMAHGEDEVQRTAQACRAVGRRLREAGLAGG